MTAVQLLERAACEGDLPRAAAARRALIDLADDDSRRVSAAASTALQLTGLRLSVPSLDFGQVMAGEPAHRPLSTRRPPAALESPVLNVTGPLNTHLDGTKLSISWTPETPDCLDAALTVSGRAGEAHLSVTGHATAAHIERRGQPPERPPKPAIEKPSPANTPALPKTVDGTIALEANKVASATTKPNDARRWGQLARPV